MERKIDVVRIRKNLIPKGKEKPARDYLTAIKGENKKMEIEESKDYLTLWETVTE